MFKQRLLYGLLAIIHIPLGLIARKYGTAWMQLYLGDVLWASMIYWLFKALLLSTTKQTAQIALGFCLFIECSQLYHEPWIDTIRQTRLGGLVLGFSFLWSDLICYSIGVFMSYSGDRVWLKK